MERHERDVDDIARQVRAFYESKQPFRIKHGSTNSTRPFLSGRKNIIDIGHLKYVIDVDVQSKTVLVEPNVPMDRLVETTLKYGLVPPVVMEFPGITVGGGYSGTSGESSSFKYGFFDQTINSVEMVLGNGDIITASRIKNPDLFHGGAGACGTLGTTTLMELTLVEAKKYVKAIFYPVDGVSAAVEKIHDVIQHRDGPDYVDGILFSQTQGVIITGQLTDERTENPIPTFSHAGDPWFYLYAKDVIYDPRPAQPVIEYIPLEEYLFRYDRGGFWVGYSAFQYFYTPFNKFTRWFLDDFLRTRMMYTALHASTQAKNFIVQDLALPFPKAVEFIDFTHETFNIYPLWLCPFRQSPSPTFHPHTLPLSPSPSPSDRTTQTPTPNNTTSSPSSPLLNIGLWGYAPKPHTPSAFTALNRLLERKLHSLGGTKWLYAHTYYTESEFWAIYDRGWYDALRQKYHAESLPSVWEKVSVDVEAERREVERSWALWVLRLWPLSGLWGLWKAMCSGGYKLADRRRWEFVEEKDRGGGG